MVTLTDKAIKAVSRFINGADDDAQGLRIQITGAVAPVFSAA